MHRCTITMSIFLIVMLHAHADFNTNNQAEKQTEIFERPFVPTQRSLPAVDSSLPSPAISRSSVHHHHHPETPYTGFWRKKVIWKPRWVKTWHEKTILVGVWKRMWGPAIIQDWIPVPKPLRSWH